jgi:hypothetical protein
MCLDAAISTDDVGIGSPEASTGAPLADIAAGLGDLEEEVRDARRPDPDGNGEAMERGERWSWGPVVEALCQSATFLRCSCLRGLWGAGAKDIEVLVLLGFIWAYRLGLFICAKFQGWQLEAYLLGFLSPAHRRG